MADNWSHIHKPQLVVDESIVRRNIRSMVKKADADGKSLRPHMKTHQSLEVGRWMREEGIESITVSSVGMAEYFAKDGWTDILIAFPCNVREIEEINALAKEISLKVLVDIPETITALDALIEARLGVLIEVDCGYGRTGVPWSDKSRIELLAGMVKDSDKLKFCGYYTHAGHTYNARGADEIMQTGLTAISNFESAVGNDFEDAIYGDTPSCSVLEAFGNTITSLSPGNFVFYDLAQVDKGSCDLADVAVAVFCPVVTKNESITTLYGGGAHFSKDTLDDDSYGKEVEILPTGWKTEIKSTLIKVSQEHGTLNRTDTNPGEVVAILPVHSCMTAEIIGSYITLEGNVLDHYLKNK